MRAIRMMRGLGVLALAAAIAACVLLVTLRPQWIEYKEGPQSILHEEGIFEAFQVPWYFLAVIALAWFGWRGQRGVRGFYAAAALGFFVLGWREADIDTILLGERWYNAPGLWFKAKATWPATLGATAIFAAFAVAIALILRHNHGGVGRWYASRRWLRSHLVLAAGFALLACSVLIDKHGTLTKNTGIPFDDIPFKPFLEEAFELLGAIVLAMGAVELAALADAPSSTPLAAVAPVDSSHAPPP